MARGRWDSVLILMLLGLVFFLVDVPDDITGCDPQGTIGSSLDDVGHGCPSVFKVYVKQIVKLHLALTDGRPKVAGSEYFNNKIAR